MKQITQRLRDGRIELLEVPPPSVTLDGVLVDVRASLLSTGTERAKVKTGQQSLLGKARSRPDQVRQVLDKAQRDGVRETVRTVRSRLEAPAPLGYSSAGVILEVGARVTDLAPGDRVACGGADYAVHAEIDHVPGNLCVRLPDTVAFEAASFATVGSIALHGVRQADVRLGERVAVIGLGLVGNLAAQLLRAAGCAVVGVDLSSDLLARAREMGAVDVAFTRSSLDSRNLPPEARDCDAVLITAATPSDDPIELAAALSRDRGRIVVVGDVGLNVPRAPYFEKELDIRLSRSYGPGRYDREYEERGLDYPIGYVRWTERRNMAAFVQLLADGRVGVDPLITERVPIERGTEAYDRLTTAEDSPLALVLTYGPLATPSAPQPRAPVPRAIVDPPSVGVIGAGNFTQRTVVPALRRAGFRLVAAASATGRTARSMADQSGFERTATPEALIAADDIDLVVVTTRHGSHAALTLAALEAGKATFVEKPPCVTPDELEALRAADAGAPVPLMVGFNRRFAPHAIAMRNALRPESTPFELDITVNAGRLPDGHWLNDPFDGGGRLIGEGCHFIDLACWFAGRLPRTIACTLLSDAGQPLELGQSFAATLDFGDSIAVIRYGARGASGMPKERFEAHAAGRSAVLDDFQRLSILGGRRRRSARSSTRDKGHAEQFAHVRSVLSGAAQPTAPPPLDTMSVVFAAARAAASGATVALHDDLTATASTVGHGEE